jgi:hypothetical protein
VLERGANFSLVRSRRPRGARRHHQVRQQFKNWREHDWVNPLLSGNIAIHFNNRTFKTSFSRGSKLWPTSFASRSDVTEIQNHADRVTLRVDGSSPRFDYVVDLHGDAGSFDGYTMSDCTLLDRCRVHVERVRLRGLHRPHRDTRRLDVRSAAQRTTSASATSTRALSRTHRRRERDDALLACRRSRRSATTQHYAFRCYYANELVSGRVCKNGNKALFFEPLLANSMFLYIFARG